MFPLSVIFSIYYDFIVINITTTIIIILIMKLFLSQPQVFSVLPLQFCSPLPWEEVEGTQGLNKQQDSAYLSAGVKPWQAIILFHWRETYTEWFLKTSKEFFKHIKAESNQQLWTEMHKSETQMYPVRKNFLSYHICDPLCHSLTEAFSHRLHMKCKFIRLTHYFTNT